MCAQAMKPPIPGIDDERIFTFRTGHRHHQGIYRREASRAGNRRRRIAADAISAAAGGASSSGAGGRKYGGAIGTSIAKVFDLTVACTGLSEKACDRDRITHGAVIVHPSSHAGCYPDAKPFSLKVVFDPATGKLLGAQAVGYDGVDKRIDVIAAFLSMGAGVDELTKFEHAYAPSFLT